MQQRLPAARELKLPSIVTPGIQQHLAINSKVTITGNIECDGPVAVEGTVHGEIKSTFVTVARYGTVTGRIIAEEVTVEGGVSGEIYANKLTLKPNCDVEGEIFHRELSLEDGSYFEGKSRPHKDPLELAKTATSGLAA